jgi:hypothetical protein
MMVAGAAPASAITRAAAVHPGTGALATPRVIASSMTVTSTTQRLRPPVNTAMAAAVVAIAAASQILAPTSVLRA